MCWRLVDPREKVGRAANPDNLKYSRSALIAQEFSTKELSTTFEILFIDNFTGTIKTANTADKFVGAATVGITASVAGKQFQVSPGDNEVNLNGEAGGSNATTGGLKGSRIKFTAIAANLYAVEGQLVGGGSIATPFDAQ